MTVISVYNVFLVTVVAIAKITERYTKNVNPIPANVPLGIETLGFFKSPDILAPANTPAVAGKNTPKTLAIVSVRRGFELPAAPDVNLGQRLSRSDFNDIPVYFMFPPERFESEKGWTRNEDRGIENDETMRMTNKRPEAREKAFDPTNEMSVTTSNINEAYKNSHHPPYLSAQLSAQPMRISPLVTKLPIPLHFPQNSRVTAPQNQ
jgi:hypothetical protein